MSLLSIALTQIQLPPDYGTATREAAAGKEARSPDKRINTRPADVRLAEGARNRARLMRAILLKPGQIRAEIIQSSGLSRAVVAHHLQPLVTAGKVTAITNGRSTRYYPAIAERNDEVHRMDASSGPSGGADCSAS